MMWLTVPMIGFGVTVVFFLGLLLGITIGHRDLKALFREELKHNRRQHEALVIATRSNQEMTQRNHDREVAAAKDEALPVLPRRPR
jgi:uncharacterized protein (DUF2225 family)